MAVQDDMYLSGDSKGEAALAPLTRVVYCRRQHRIVEECQGKAGVAAPCRFRKKSYVSW